MNAFQRFAAGAAAVFCVAAHAATIDGSGRAATQRRAAHDIDAVAVSLASEVVVRQGTSEGVEITADDNLLPYIETVVENGVLRVRPRDDTSLSMRTPVRVTVTARAPQLLAVSGSARITASGLVVQRLELKLSGSGRVQASGVSPLVAAHVSGSGVVDAASVSAQDATAVVSGSGRVKVSARRKLSATISGSGAVDYYGDPEVHKVIAGSGRVQRLGERAG